MQNERKTDASTSRMASPHQSRNHERLRGGVRVSVIVSDAAERVLGADTEPACDSDKDTRFDSVTSDDEREDEKPARDTEATIVSLSWEGLALIEVLAIDSVSSVVPDFDAKEQLDVTVGVLQDAELLILPEAVNPNEYDKESPRRILLLDAL